jgi:hypothetical protein
VENTSGYVHEGRISPGVVSYLHGRQLPNGAYSSIYCEGVELPSIKDTGWALRSFRILEIQPERSADTLAWLMHIERNLLSAGDIESVSLFVEGILVLGGKVPDLSEFLKGSRERLFPGEGSRFEEEGRLEEFRLWLELEQKGPGKDPEGRGKIRDFLEDRFLPREREDLPSLSDGLLACRSSGIDLPPMSLERWEAFQDPVTGFRFTPYSRMATIKTLWAGLRISELYGLTVRYREEIRDYADFCRTKNGGYGRRPGAVPDIESTGIALLVLESLSNLYHRYPDCQKPKGEGLNLRKTFPMGVGLDRFGA